MYFNQDDAPQLGGSGDGRQRKYRRVGEVLSVRVTLNDLRNGSEIQVQVTLGTQPTH